MALQLSEKTTARVGTFAVALTFVFHLLYSFGFFPRVGIFLNGLQMRAISLFLILFLVFIFTSQKKGLPRNTVPWYDVIFILVSLAFTVYIVWGYDYYWLYLGTARTTPEIVLGLMAIIIILETCRRTVGWAIVFVIVFFLLYTLFGNYALGFFKTPPTSIPQLSGGMWLGDFGIYGVAVGVILDYVFAFILFSTALQAVGGGEFFRRLAIGAFSKMRGGSAKIAVAMNYFFGMVSGSSVASVFVTGPLVLPEMEKEGFKPHFAGGLLAVAANGAQLAPPVMGIVAFVMADLLGMRYFQIVLAAAIPALLYFVSLFLFCDLEAAKEGLHPPPALAKERVPLMKILLDGWHIILSIGILIWLLGGMLTTARMAVVLVSVLLILLGLLRKQTRVNFRQLGRIAESTSKSLIGIGPICAGAGLIVGSIALTSLDYKFSVGLIGFAGGNLLLVLFFTALACFVLGMGMPTLPAYLVVALVMTPALLPFGLEPIMIHMFVFYFGLAAMVTPPVCISVYVVLPMVKTSFWRVAASAVRLGIATFIVPSMFMFQPGLLLIGSPLDIVSATVIAIIATAGLCFGLTRYGLVSANWLEAIAGIGGGILLFLPYDWSFTAGASLLAAVVIFQVIKWLIKRRSTTPP